MDASPLLHPVGPEPARTYWLRRAVLLGVVLVIVLSIAYACSGDGSGHPSRRAGGPAPAATSSSPEPAPVVHRCGPRRLQVEAATDAETYPVGSSPRLTAVVRNVSEDPCRLATQPSARSWTVSSGADQVWATADCSRKGAVALNRLKPGKQVTYAVSWDGHRSEPGCAAPGEQAQPGTYRLDVIVDGARADPVIFHLSG